MLFCIANYICFHSCIMPSLSVCLSLAYAALCKCKIVVSPRSSKCSVVLPPDIEYVTTIIKPII